MIPAREQSDRFDAAISTLLRAGVLVSFLTLMAGFSIGFLHDDAFTSQPGKLDRLVHPSRPPPHTLGQAISLTLRGDAQGLLILGAIVLIATPIIRIVVSLGMFARLRDRAFTIITAVVLVLLLLGVWLGSVE